MRKRNGSVDHQNYEDDLRGNVESMSMFIVFSTDTWNFPE